MNTATATYAGRKRKKPQKSAKQKPAESNVVVKSNPSKRHRERLNGELERLAALLPFPQDVISKLDKLTVLRLSVSYLRAKSHFNVTVKSRTVPQIEGNGVTDNRLQIPEGELLLQVLNGFVLVVTAAGTIFYASSTIQDYLGYPQSDVIHMSVYDFIHAEDRAEFQRHLHWALRSPQDAVPAGEDSRDLQRYCTPEQLPPEDSSFLQRNFVCRFRCLLDCSSGFLALNFHGRLKFLHGQNEKDEQGKPVPPQLALFAMASPLQPLSILEIRTKNYFFKTKHKLDFTPTACDAKGKIVMGYTDAELCGRGSGYQFVHAADMLHCSDAHMRMMKTGESGMTVFRLLTKVNGWVWVQSSARLVYKNARPDFIICSERVLTDEEGEENLRKRSAQLPFSFTTGEAVLYNDADFPPAAPPTGSPPAGAAANNNNNNQEVETLNPDSLLGSLMKQDMKSIYPCHPDHGEHAHAHAHAAPPPADGSSPQAGAMAGGGDYGRVFSSSWQESFLSLSESSVFMFEPPQQHCPVEEDAELWSFMRSLGICREDLELFQQDETFLNVELDNRGDAVPDFTEEILSYVQESLRKRTDGVLSGVHADRLGGQDLGGCGSGSLVLQHRANSHQQPEERRQPAAASCWEEQQAALPQLQPQCRLLSQSMTQSMTLSMPQSMPQSMTQSMTLSMPQSMTQSMTQSMPQSMTQSMTQSMPQSMTQSMTQSMPQSMPQSMAMSQCMQQSMPLPQCMQQSMPLPQCMQQSMPQSLQQSMPQSMPQPLQQSMPQSMPQSLQQSMPQSMPQSLQQSMPQSLQQSFAQALPQSLPHSFQYKQQALIQQQPSHPQTLAPTTEHQLHGQAQPLTPQQYQPPYGPPCQQQQQQQHVQCTQQQQQQQLCYVPKPYQAAVNNSYGFLSQEGGGSSGQHVATLFPMDQTGLRRDGQPQQHAYVHPGQTSRGLLLNAGPNPCMQAANCASTTTGQIASGMAGSGAEAQQNGKGPPLVWNMYQQQQLCADPQASSKAFTMHVNTADQPHTMQFQTTTTGPVSARNGTSGRPEQPPPQNLRLGRDAV